MKPQYHFIATITISSIIYSLSREASCFIASFIGGFLIDVDHLFDYYREIGFNLKIGRFFKMCNENKIERLTIIFHSLELILALWLAIFYFKLGLLWVSFALGLSQHIFFDIIFNSCLIRTSYFYFFTARALKGFRFKEFLR